MIRTSYKSLDRPMDFFGLKGRWIIVFLACVGIAVLLGIMIGVSVTSAYGIATAILGAIAAFIFCLLRQQTVSDRKIVRYLVSSKCSRDVTRREQLSRILLPEEDFEKASKFKIQRNRTT